MRLKKIRLAGFKSFVDPTNIPFPGDMTAVVGPNGCGKSNVIDAVRWVLGESSAKNLRGDAMTDVIFNGSSARKAVSQCSVELVFDNSSGRIAGEYANYNELSVKRIVTKEAVSSYQLNSAKCRRRDITDLFLGTGLGPRSYAIIEQGMISKLIESKPQELRVFIEEAAGISKYKERRKETLNRISHTKDNLERLEDVRQELGDQLAKLKRQAAAATRYKELKAQERQLKGQVTTLKWLAQSEALRQSDETIAGFKAELDSLLSGRQGDESGLQSLKNDQALCKQAINELQQSIYHLGNDITKLEQSQLFARKRTAQIQSEIQVLTQQSQEAKTALHSIEEEIATQEAQIVEAQPQKEILQEQLDEIEQRHQDLLEQQRALNAQSKADDDRYYAHKQRLQQKHGQLQQTISLQQRTESRIAELEQELASTQSVDNETIEALSESLLDFQAQLSRAKAKTQQANQDLMQANADLKQTSQDEKETEKALVKLDAQIAALQSLQREDEAALPSFLERADSAPAWQCLSVQQGYEKALESALSFLGKPLLLQSFNATQLIAALEQQVDNNSDNAQDVGIEKSPHADAPSLLLAQAFVSNKKAGSLASYLEQDEVPAIFNQLIVAEDLEAAKALLLSHKESAERQLTRSASEQNRDVEPVLVEPLTILKEGGIINSQMLIRFDTSEHGQVQRQSQITELKQESQNLAQALSKLSASTQAKEQARDRVEQDARDAQQSEYQVANALALAKRDLDNARQQQNEVQARLNRINTDIESQKETLLQEQESSELLSEEIEELSIESAELEAQKFDADAKKESLDIQLQAVQSQQQQAQSQLHESVVLNQALQNSYQILQEQRKNKDQLLQDFEEKRLLLQEEAENLLLPSDEQAEKLQEMLEKKANLGEQQQEKQLALDDIEEQISTLEKGQVGINAKIDSIKQKIESEGLLAQTARVKAQSYIEQLSEMQMKVNEVLETFPEEESPSSSPLQEDLLKSGIDSAQEKAYQEKLDAVQSSLSRLGAVNLAAVEEFEEQGKRKQHLDEQNADLTQALDTLESAMRKIDKETRSRFKQTFEQVNGDLKTLFPKVFGGGSAYLALTDDDLLDTGVTIMARPPGKKNSTIHLLSGGEKALTALSLVFAIFRLNPAPFCLLDEVDAPLDDANVGRFCKLVSEMSKTVQFIYITHNKVAMEMATHLTGVTMAEPGVSRMVSVDMEEALAIAE